MYGNIMIRSIFLCVFLRRLDACQLICKLSIDTYISNTYEMCVQQGWEEGEGLGKNKQGIKGYVRVQNKQDTAGFF